MTQALFRCLLILGVLVLIVLQFQLWIGEGSIAHILELENSIADLEQENQTLRAHNERLAAEVLNLKNSSEAVEERARKELGMIKNDETFYLIIDSNDDP